MGLPNYLAHNFVPEFVGELSNLCRSLTLFSFTLHLEDCVVSVGRCV